MKVKIHRKIVTTAPPIPKTSWVKKAKVRSGIRGAGFFSDSKLSTEKSTKIFHFVCKEVANANKL